jgi:hypothetical protein
MSASLFVKQKAYHRLSGRTRLAGRHLLASPFAPLRARAHRHVINENLGLPVLRGERLVGILTRTDLLIAFATQHEGGRSKE